MIGDDEPAGVRELTKPWRSRVRMDRSVTGAINLAYLRGYQAGYEDAKGGQRAQHFVNPISRRRKK